MLSYSADGRKLRQEERWNPTPSATPEIGSALNEATLTQRKTTDYVGNKVYENGVLKQILLEGGYSDMKDGYPKRKTNN